MKNNKLNLKVNAKDKTSGDEYRFSIDFYVFKQDGKFISYCPSVDLSSSGDNFNDAISAFYEAFQLYVETCVEMGTLQEDLIRHGWKVKKTGVTPPRFSSMLKKKEMKNLMESEINYQRLVTPISIPAFQ